MRLDVFQEILVKLADRLFVKDSKLFSLNILHLFVEMIKLAGN